VNEWITSYARGNALSHLCIAVVTFLFLGSVAVIISAICTGIENKLFQLDLCMASTCLSYAQEQYKGVLSLAASIGQFVVGFATVGGIAIALLGYINSANATMFGNHVANTKVFVEYMTLEISKRSRISLASVDIYFIYSLMFAGSASGEMKVSDDYKKKVMEIRKLIEASNALVTAPNPEGFSYKKHQARLIRCLEELGFKVTPQPRIDFYEVEGEVFELLDSLNHVFGGGSNRIEKLPARHYR